MVRRRSLKLPCGAACCAVSVVSARLCAASRSSLALSVRSASTSRGDVLEDREDGGLAAEGDAPCRRRRPERAAAGPAQLEAEVVGPALAHDLLGHPAPLVRIHVVVGRVTADGLVLGDTEHIRGALVDGQDAVIRAAA